MGMYIRIWEKQDKILSSGKPTFEKNIFFFVNMGKISPFSTFSTDFSTKTAGERGDYC